MAKQSTHHCCRSLLAAQLAQNTPSGPVVAFTLSSGSVNGDYYFDRIDPNGGDTLWIWAKVGGDPAQDYLSYQLNAGQVSVFQGGVEQYLGVGGEIDPVVPDPTTIPVWFAVSGAEPTPTFS